MVGQRFGRLVVLSVEFKGRHAWCECQCDCGNKKRTRKSSLVAGCTKSCGCLQSENATQRNFKHGKSASPEWVVWHSMKERCYTPTHKSYGLYGGRGIKVCDRWLHSFENFLADMGERPSPRHSIDRIDGNGNYEPGNCRWATAKEQANNRRPYRAAATKLHGEDIPKIRQMIASGTHYKEIGALFGVTESAIGSIAKGRTWKSIQSSDKAAGAEVVA